MDAIALAAERLQAADACHDEDPARGAALLREIDPAALDAGQRPRYAFLLNHVLAEKMGQAGEAWQRQQALLAAAGSETPLPLLRHAGAAAHLAGDLAGATRLTARVADVAAVPLIQAAELMALAAASFEVPGLHGDAAGEAALAALAPLHDAPWQRATGLDAAAGALANNIASDLAERPLAELASPPLRDALAQAATLAQGLWHRAGQWVHHERAHYLCALAANALGQPAEAESQARAGLVLIANFDRDGQESVDRAFLLSELAQALAREGRLAEAEVERAQADALADAFDDPALVSWYRRRVARQAELDQALTAPIA
jgi:hypothetical protein